LEVVVLFRFGRAGGEGSFGGVGSCCWRGELGGPEKTVALEVLDHAAGEVDLKVLEETVALEVLDASLEEMVALAPSLEIRCFSLAIER
jgi:hypothetical protein